MSELATAQHGVVSRRQLIGLGLSPSAVDGWVKEKRLCPVQRSVYAVGHEAFGPLTRVMAAVLALGDGAVASHRTAAMLWSLLPDARTTIDVTVPTRRRGRAGVAVHTSCLAATDLTTIDGVPVTSPARTLLDIAETVSARQLERAIEESERAGLFDLAALEDVMDRGIGRRGLGRLRAALAHLHPTGLSRSELERRFMELVKQAGLPLPSQNVNLHGYEVDAVWKDQRIVVELDGYEYHRTRTAFERDRQRDARLQAAGWRVLRFSWRQVVMAPETVVTALRRTLTQA